MAETIENTAIKRKKTGETKVDKKETETHNNIDHATAKQLPYTDKEGKYDETSSKTALTCQETQPEEVAAQYNKT